MRQDVRGERRDFDFKTRERSPRAIDMFVLPVEMVQRVRRTTVVSFILIQLVRRNTLTVNDTGLSTLRTSTFGARASVTIRFERCHGETVRERVCGKTDREGLLRRHHETDRFDGDDGQGQRVLV